MLPVSGVRKKEGRTHHWKRQMITLTLDLVQKVCPVDAV
jgi:hypothetical protein